MTSNEKYDTKIKKSLMEDGTFEKASYTPYIGNGYENAEEKILFVGDCRLPIKEYESKRKTNNYCNRIIDYCSQNLKTKKTELRMGIDAINGLKKFINENEKKWENISYYNFFFNQFDKHADKSIFFNQGPAGDILEQYLTALKKVVVALKPTKILLLGNAIKTKINDRLKYPKSFNGKKFLAWITSMEIEYSVIPLRQPHIVRNKLGDQATVPIRPYSDLELCINNIGNFKKRFSILRDLSDLLTPHITDKTRYSELSKIPSNDIDPFDPVFPEKIILDNFDACIIYLCMRKINQTRKALIRIKEKIEAKKAYQTPQERINEKKARYFEFMLDLIHPEHLYIAHTLIPSFLKYIDQKDELEDEMFDGEADISTAEFNQFLKKLHEKNALEKARGIELTLNSVYKIFCSNESKNKYAKMMKESIFISEKDDQICRLYNKKDLSGRKKWSPWSTK